MAPVALTGPDFDTGLEADLFFPVKELLSLLYLGSLADLWEGLAGALTYGLDAFLSTALEVIEGLFFSEAREVCLFTWAVYAVLAGFEPDLSACLVCLTADLDLELFPYLPSFVFWSTLDDLAVALSGLIEVFESDFLAKDEVTLAADTDLLAFGSGFEFLTV